MTEMRKMKRAAWGITGSGDRLPEVVEVMKQIKKQYHSDVRITVYLSKAGDLVVKWYKLDEELKKSFARVLIETDSNTPFLAGQLQVGSFEFLLIAPTTSNTVAKISAGIADSMLSNSAAMALKGGVPVYVMPSDYKEGKMITKLPDGRDAEVRVRRKDVENVETLRRMDSLSVLESPEELQKVFSKHFKFEGDSTRAAKE